MKIIYASQAAEDLKYWEMFDKKIVQRINQLLDDIQKHPFTGIGKPEPLKFNKSGYWSRRINQLHRLVYKVQDDIVYIAQCRWHYLKD